jgi:hypothetical protein
LSLNPNKEGDPMKKVLASSKKGCPFSVLARLKIEVYGFKVNQVNSELLEITQGTSNIPLEDIFDQETIKRLADREIDVDIVDEKMN